MSARVTTEDWPASTRRLTDATDRVAELLDQVDDVSRPVIGSEWTIGQVASHLASLSDAYLGITAGEPSPYPDTPTRVQVNHARVVAEQERDVRLTADRFVAAMGRAAENLSAADPSRTYTHAGVVLTAPAFLGLFLGEFLVHGLDIARTVRRPWPLARADALMVLEVIGPMAPAVVDRDGARGVTATFDLHIRGGKRSTFAFRDGELTVADGSPARADVHMSIDPVGCMLLLYRRVGVLHELVRGRAVAWGRKPWLAFSFLNYLEAP